MSDVTIFFTVFRYVMHVAVTITNFYLRLIIVVAALKGGLVIIIFIRSWDKSVASSRSFISMTFLRRLYIIH